MSVRSLRSMKSVIKCLLVAFLTGVGGMVQAQSNATIEILRNAALRNGLRPVKQLFDSTDSNLAVVGKTFFESENVSLNGGMSCRTCHLDEFGSADGLPNAVGILGAGKGPERALSDGLIVPRNTLPLWGRGVLGFDVFFWDGKVDFSGENPLSQFGDAPPSQDALLTAVHLPPVEIREMIRDDADISRYQLESPQQAQELYERVAARLFETEYPAIVELATQLGKRAPEMTFHDVARSIAAFIRAEFRLRDTAFHRFVFGQKELAADQIQGGIIFYGKGKCVNCHTGPYFSDLRFHAVPFPQLGFGKNGFGVDYGRFNVTFDPDDLYKFRTPPLFNVTKTAPYGHAGALPTIKDAIIAHFDPLRYLEPESMDNLARHEFFKRMAAVGDEFKHVSVLSDREVEQVTNFLETLSFGRQPAR